MEQGSLIYIWAVTSLFFSISGVASWCLLRKTTKQVSLVYLYKFVKGYEKARETSVTSFWKYAKLCKHFENRCHHAEMVDKKRINVLVSPYFTLLFWRKLNTEFSKVDISTEILAIHNR